MKYLIFRLILFLTLIILSKEVDYKTEITITIYGKGNQNILSDSTTCRNIATAFDNLPQEIIINGEKQRTVQRNYYFNDSINNITMKWKEDLTHCNNMFNSLNNIIFFDFSKFDTSKVESMSCMFYNCSNITSINLSNFDTSLVTNMNEMFSECHELKSLDLNNFNTSLVTTMYHMFYQCFNLTSINLKSFNTSQVVNMTGMFQVCNSLKSLDINHFNTSSVKSMWAMFHLCKQLTSLDLSNFDTSEVTDMRIMFQDCTSLNYLNLYNFETSKVRNNDNMFSGTNLNPNLSICFNSSKTSKINDLLPIEKKNCSLLCLLNPNKKLIIENEICLDDCKNDNKYKFKFNNICYTSCPNGTHNSSNEEYLCEEDLICDKYYNYNYTACLDEIPPGYYLNDSNRKTIDKCDIKCGNCTKDSIEVNLCISCNNKFFYYNKLNDSSNKGSFIECYNEKPEGYFLDNNIYKPCYPTCKNCSTFGDSNNNTVNLVVSLAP